MRQLTILVTVLILSGCATTTTIKTTGQLCSELGNLITAYDNSFEAFKQTKRPTRLMDIWQTDFHFVGQSCEIWAWGAGKVDYMCNRAFPTRETAEERYATARDELQNCLVGWQSTESTRKLGEGKKLVFQKDSSLPVVALHLINTSGAYASQWTAYLFVGDQNKDL
jgi:hypothetical protein